MRLNSQIISLTVTAIILIILFALGETSAFNLIPSPDKNRATSGEKINIHATIELDEGEHGVESLILKITGPKNISCSFNANGTAIGKCDGIEVKKLSNDIEYGYPGKKSQKYKITIDTSFFKPGDYNIRITAKSGEQTSVKDVKITINEFMCSVRAKNGNGEYKEIGFSNNKINFFVSKSNSNDGTGSLVMQKSKNRVSISFSKSEIIKADNDSLVLRVDGKGTYNREDIEFKEAVITVDKLDNRVSFIDSSEDINVEDMDIYFIKGCWCFRK